MIWDRPTDRKGLWGGAKKNCPPQKSKWNKHHAETPIWQFDKKQEQQQKNIKFLYQVLL